MTHFSLGRRAFGVVLSTVVFACGSGVEAKPKHVAAHASTATGPAHRTVTPYIVMDFASARVIDQRESTRSWYPASITKLMTVYVALQAVEQGRLTLDTPMVVTARAASMKPSKMGFAPGTQVTLDNALKMLMVKSANDLAITIAEGVSGSVEAFANEMNKAGDSLGLHESHFVNPNGLPDDRQVTSARDMALIGRALYLRFPQHADLFDIGAFKLGDQIVPTHNGMIGRYPGADGMKTGFTCPAGFNLVASATREGRKVIVVVLGAPSARQRTAHAADLFDRAFATSQVGDQAADLPSIGGAPPDMRGEICVRRSKQAQLAAETEDLAAPIQADASGAPSAAQPSNGALIAALPRPVYEPINVFVGPPNGYQGPVAGPRPADAPIGMVAYAPAKPVTPTAIKPDPEALSMRRGKVLEKRSPAKSETAKLTSASGDKGSPKPVAKTSEKKSAHSSAKAETSKKTSAGKAGSAHGDAVQDVDHSPADKVAAPN